VGDRVTLSGAPGVVVASMDMAEYSAEYTETHWGYLKRGVMIEFQKYGLIHFESADEDLVLVEHAPAAGER
jgi:hypothetical protein